MVTVGIEEAVLLVAGIEMRTGAAESRRDAQANGVEVYAVRPDAQSGDTDRNEQAGGRIGESRGPDGRVRDVVDRGAGADIDLYRRRRRRLHWRLHGRRRSNHCLAR